MAAAQNLLIEISPAERDCKRAQQDLRRALKTLEGTDLPLAAWLVYARAAELCERQSHKQEAMEYRTQCASEIKRIAERLSEYPDLRQKFLTSPHLPAKLRRILGSGSNAPHDLLSA